MFTVKVLIDIHTYFNYQCNTWREASYLRTVMELRNLQVWIVDSRGNEISFYGE